MLDSAQIKKVIAVLNREFPHPKPPLNFKSPFELLVGVVLSAQCTDERVNRVTPTLFPRYNTPKKLLTLGFSKLRDIIHSCGYHNQKTKSLLACCQKLIQEYDGKIPDTLEKLMALPGIGRKSASVILAQAYGIPAFPVDTHVFRVANRLGLIREKTPDKTALALERCIPRESWIPLHLQLIFHGRKTCKAQKPRCSECPLREVCEEGVGEIAGNTHLKTFYLKKSPDQSIKPPWKRPPKNQKSITSSSPRISPKFGQTKAI